jgi:serralysin
VWLGGGAGNDRYNAIGTDKPSRVDFFGGFGDDVLTGTQREQRLFGFDGDDQISGGPATDELHGGPGHDRIDARAGELDTVDCGGQLFDEVLADPLETSVVGC